MRWFIVTRDKARKLSELLYISNKIDNLYIDRKYKKALELNK